MSKFVNSKIKLNIPQINKLSKSATKALEMTTEHLHTEVRNDQVMPFREGHLSGELTAPDYSEIEQGKANINTEGPYARRLYFHPEYNFNRNENKNAKGKWYEDYISGTKKNFCKEIFTELYKKGAGL